MQQVCGFDTKLLAPLKATINNATLTEKGSGAIS